MNLGPSTKRGLPHMPQQQSQAKHNNNINIVEDKESSGRKPYAKASLTGLAQ